MIGIWAGLALDFATFSMFCPILSLIMGKYCNFCNFFATQVCGRQNDSIRPWLPLAYLTGLPIIILIAEYMAVSAYVLNIHLLKR